MEQSIPKIFVIVVTYKGKQWYDRCFTSLRNSTIPVQTIVVDNASNDGTVEYIRENYPEICLIESEENLGFGKANNIGMRFALEHDCDYVFLLNQDAWVESDTFEKLVKIHQKYQEYGIVSPMHLNGDRTGLAMKDFCRQPCNEKLITDLYLNTISDIYETTYIHAAAWLLPRRTLQTIGGFDPIFPHYGEDDDYLHRVLFHGLKIGVCPSTCIVHDHQEHQKTNVQWQYFHDLSKLVAYLDINQPFKFWDYLRHYMGRWLLSVCRFDWEQSRGLVKDVRFLRRKAREIKNHRKQNMRVGETWLQG